ncbi:MAG: ABC transporter substrate-binding protein [Candidatus Dojkabacteria bacterium]|jgi:peptide/nickel transport system substrate-binding protein|nr:ABC transporter substrate-binding protein [Candidatus Dojkabacteria bacterium]
MGQTTQGFEKGRKGKLSMKEAFELMRPSQDVIKVGVTDRKRFSLRDALWNYPENIIKVFKNSSPLSFILIFLLLGFGMFSFLRSDALAEVLSSRKASVFVEGNVGAISTFNPLFISQNVVDKDIQALVFEKFIDIAKDGTPQPNVAKEWVVAQDGKTYDFMISLDHKWQDGQKLTIEDVIFTFELAKTLSRDHGYDTVGSSLVDVKIDRIADDKLRFTLPESNSTFFEVVSEYIVPKHILEEVAVADIPFNSFARYPIGSGPYKVYRSEPNVVYLKASEYYWVTPKIDTIVYRLYSDYKALEGAFRNGILDAMGGVDSHSMSFSSEYSEYEEYETALDSRIRMIIFNTRKEKLENKDIRKGINYLIEKGRLLEDAQISGVVSNGPIAQSSWAYNKDITVYEYNQEKAAEYFKSAGYTKNQETGYFESEDKKILSFTLSYYNNDFNNRLANVFKDMLKDGGVVINLEPLSYTQLSQEIVATRDFELLMYEIITTVDPDQYNLWHSLKSNYPDLNLSGYSYERVDILLEDARRNVDRKVRTEKYILFQKYLTQDAPVLFLYHPNYRYVVKKDIKVGDLESIIFPHQRFEDIAYWSK